MEKGHIEGDQRKEMQRSSPEMRRDEGGEADTQAGNQER